VFSVPLKLSGILDLDIGREGRKCPGLGEDSGGMILYLGKKLSESLLKYGEAFRITF